MSCDCRRTGSGCHVIVGVQEVGVAAARRGASAARNQSLAQSTLLPQLCTGKCCQIGGARWQGW